MVGYKEPPLHSRFKAGVSGNPKGRPKNRPSLQCELNDALAEPVTVGGRQTTKLGAIVSAVVAKAVAGDLRAANTILSLCSRAFGVEAPADDAIDPSDRTIVEASEKRERKRARANVPVSAAW